MTDEEKENIKYRLSDIGKQVGVLALEYISDLEKENAELKAQIESLTNINIKAQNIIAELKKQNESLKDTLQAIATDTNEHITHNAAQNELDKWEIAE